MKDNSTVEPPSWQGKCDMILSRVYTLVFFFLGGGGRGKRKGRRYMKMGRGERRRGKARVIRG